MKTKTITSETSPIYINEIAPAGAAGEGWVAITFAPGKKTMGGFNYWDRDLNMDLDRLRSLGANTLVALLEDDEIERLKIPTLVRMAQSKGFQVRRFAFHDDGIPKDMEHTLKFIREIAGRRRAGESVVMHCNGGLGRSGTMAACLRLAILLDRTVENAIASVRRIRGSRAIRKAAQENFIKDFFKAWRRLMPKDQSHDEFFTLGHWYPRKPGPGVEEGERVWVGHDLVNDVCWQEELGVYTIPMMSTPGGGDISGCEFTSHWGAAKGWVETVPVFFGGRVVMSDVINDGELFMYITWTNLNEGPVLMEEVK